MPISHRQRCGHKRERRLGSENLRRPTIGASASIAICGYVRTTSSAERKEASLSASTSVLLWVYTSMSRSLVHCIMGRDRLRGPLEILL
jgi:hypothetical protein